jgi:hypothetical protein
MVQLRKAQAETFSAKSRRKSMNDKTTMRRLWAYPLPYPQSSLLAGLRGDEVCAVDMSNMQMNVLSLLGKKTESTHTMSGRFLGGCLFFRQR